MDFSSTLSASEDEDVNIPETLCHFSQLHLDRLNDLVDPLAICADYGISFFLSTLQFVEAV